MRASQIISVISLIVCFISCKANNAQTIEGQSYLFKEDTLFSKYDSCSPNSANKNFFDFKGLQISNDYIIKDSLHLNIKNDQLPDWVIVLSPIIQENETYASKCYNTKFNKRILLAFNSKNKNAKIFLNENVILNMDESQSEPFRKIEESKNGFLLKYYIGSSLRCYYDFFFSINDDSIYLYKSKYDCYKIDLSTNEQKEVEYVPSDSTNLQNLDIRKFIIIPDLNKG